MSSLSGCWVKCGSTVKSSAQALTFCKETRQEDCRSVVHWSATRLVFAVSLSRIFALWSRLLLSLELRITQHVILSVYLLTSSV